MFYPVTALVKPEIGASVMEMDPDISKGFIGHDIMPLVPVGEQAATYGILTKESFTTIPETARNADGSYNVADLQFETGTYECEDHGLEGVMDESKVKRYSGLFNAEVVVASQILFLVRMAQEIRIAAVCFAGSVGTTAASVAWTTPATAVPRTDVDGVRDIIRDATGVEPDSIAMSKVAFEALVRTNALVESVKYTGGEPMETANFETQKRKVAAYLGLENVFVGTRVKNTADKNQDWTGGQVWDSTKAIVFKRASSIMSLEQAGFGVSALWTDDSPDNLTVEGYYDTSRRSDRVRARQNVDELVIAVDLARVLTGVTA